MKEEVELTQLINDFEKYIYKLKNEKLISQKEYDNLMKNKRLMEDVKVS